MMKRSSKNIDDIIILILLYNKPHKYHIFVVNMLKLLDGAKVLLETWYLVTTTLKDTND